jgi:hypothetical protein
VATAANEASENFGAALNAAAAPAAQENAAQIPEEPRTLGQQALAWLNGLAEMMGSPSGSANGAGDAPATNAQHRSEYLRERSGEAEAQKEAATNAQYRGGHLREDSEDTEALPTHPEQPNQPDGRYPEKLSGELRD